jgi:hypothetical protein
MNESFFIFTVYIFDFYCIGCSDEPVYYSKREVIKYVSETYGNLYELIEEKSYEDRHRRKKFNVMI